MHVRAFLSELVVPGIILLGTGLFWLSIRDAPSISQRVPIGVMVFILAMAAIVLVRAVLLARAAGPQPDGSPPVTPFRHWREEWAQRLAYIALGIAYYLAFDRIGFSLANFGFLVAALVVAGYHRDRTPLAATGRIALIALVATVAFHLLARVMDFNVPRGPLGF